LPNAQTTTLQRSNVRGFMGPPLTTRVEAAKENLSRFRAGSGIPRQVLFYQSDQQRSTGRRDRSAGTSSLACGCSAEARSKTAHRYKALRSPCSDTQPFSNRHNEMIELR